jgi:hypothetical protein
MGHKSLHFATTPQRFPRRVNLYFSHASLKRADLQWLIASGEAALQLPEDVAATPFGIGKQKDG